MPPKNKLLQPKLKDFLAKKKSRLNSSGVDRNEGSFTPLSTNNETGATRLTELVKKYEFMNIIIIIIGILYSLRPPLMVDLLFVQFILVQTVFIQPWICPIYFRRRPIFVHSVFVRFQSISYLCP